MAGSGLKVMRKRGQEAGRRARSPSGRWGSGLPSLGQQTQHQFATGLGFQLGPQPGSEETAQPLHPAELNRQLDALAQGGATQCYVELLAKPVRRKWEARAADAATDGPAQSPDDADTDEHPAA